MYYPFLRGKQEELLALQELLQSGKLSEKVIPIIEPIKLSSTFINTLQLFCDKERRLYLVANPTVGQFEDDLSTELVGDEPPDEKKQIERLILNQGRYNKLTTNSTINFAIYFKNDFATYFKQEPLKDKIIVIFTKEDNLDDFIDSIYSLDKRIHCVFAPGIEEIDGIKIPSVLLRDRFIKATKNSEYPEDEFFSKDHLIYSKYGFSGFSDYSIVGEKYEDSGFTPYAIAIHIVYPTDKYSLHIKHFISDSNFTSKNPAGKFSEAGKKLSIWCAQNPHIKTLGISKIMEYYQSQRYPGLGSLKRYSIMSHLEIIGDILDVIDK